MREYQCCPGDLHACTNVTSESLLVYAQVDLTGEETIPVLCDLEVERVQVTSCYAEAW
jgi:hypothetical protein